MRAKTVLLAIVTTAALALLPACEDVDARSVHYWFINVERGKYGLGNLGQSQYLQGQALAHSAYMCQSGNFEHSSLSGLYGGETWHGLGENIGWASVSGGDTKDAAFRVFDGFVKSSEHHANILGNWNDMGVGAYYCEDDNRLYVTQAFRRR